ncbi:OmpP1/FadL family transporter [Planctomycetota bacterium]
MRPASHRSGRSIASVDPKLDMVLGPILETYLPDGTRNGLRGKYDFELENFRTPALLSLGVAFRPLDTWLVALDFRYVFWKHAFREFVVKLENGSNRDINEINGTDDIRRESVLQWRDTAVLALGTAVDVSSLIGLSEPNEVSTNLILRAGYQFGESPVRTGYAVPSPAVTEYGLGLGTSLRWHELDFDLAYFHSFAATMTVDDHLSLDEWDRTAFASEEHWLYFGVGYQFD